MDPNLARSRRRRKPEPQPDSPEVNQIVVHQPDAIDWDGIEVDPCAGDRALIAQKISPARQADHPGMHASDGWVVQDDSYQ
jgi:hypothetical protein